MSDGDHPGLHNRYPLSYTLRADGRPLWEPPPIVYDDLLDEETYKNERKALLKFYQGDVVKVTQCIDWRTEGRIFRRYTNWVSENKRNAVPEHKGFLENLYDNLKIDMAESWEEWRKLGVAFALKNDDGTIGVCTVEEARKMDREQELQEARASQTGQAQKAEDGRSTPATREASQGSSVYEEAGELNIKTNISPLAAQVPLIDSQTTPASPAPSEPDETTALLPSTARTQEQSTTTDDEEDTETSLLTTLCNCACL